MTASEKNKLIKQAIDNSLLIVENNKIYRTRLAFGKTGKKELTGSNSNGYKVSSLHLNDLKFQIKHHRVIWIYHNGLYDA